MNEIQKALDATPLVPADMRDAMELAKLMANSTLVPREFQKQPANCMLVIMQAVRWEMDPFAVIQNTSIIQSKPMYNGQLVAAVVNSRGDLKEPLNYDYGDGKSGEGRFVIVSGRRRGDAEPKTVVVHLNKVRTQNQQWDKQPDQQLAYHGARVWARRWMPELMLGVYSPEEFPPERPRRIVPHGVDPDTGEITAHEEPLAPTGSLPDKDELKRRLQNAAEQGLQPLADYARNMLDVSHLDAADAEEVRAEYKRLRDSLQFVTLEAKPEAAT